MKKSYTKKQWESILKTVAKSQPPIVIIKGKKINVPQNLLTAM